MDKSIEIEIRREGGCWPNLLKMSEWIPREGKIVIYEDALQAFSRRTRFSTLQLQLLALFHEFLHVIYPKQSRQIHAAFYGFLHDSFTNVSPEGASNVTRESDCNRDLL